MHDRALAADQQSRVTWYGRTGELYALLGTNILFKILTLGVFTFWARTRKRRYFWSRTEIFDDRLEYHGRGIELFLGLLFVAAAIVLPLGLANGLAIALVPPAVLPLVQILYFLVILFLAGAGLFRATRYRLSRTRWRGVRFGLNGVASTFGRQYLLRVLFLFFTLSLYRPWFDTWRASALLGNARYGDAPVRCDLRGGSDLFGTYLLSALLAIPTFGLSLAAYRLAFLRQIANGLSLAGLTARFDATLFDLIKLRLGNALIFAGPAILSLVVLLLLVPFGTPALRADSAQAARQGFALFAALAVFGLTISIVLPLVWQRRMRFFCKHFVLLGTLATDQIRATGDDGVETGEGLESAFEIDAIG